MIADDWRLDSAAKENLSSTNLAYVTGVKRGGRGEVKFVREVRGERFRDRFALSSHFALEFYFPTSLPFVRQPRRLHLKYKFESTNTKRRRCYHIVLVFVENTAVLTLKMTSPQVAET